ncbi:pilus assembly protein PilM [Butyrivibrio sp. INlla16]|uniref:pilus assembly protein PilM n=1 Tax=Butyrivibrio sp. INlla16 TaxID=1520807 RepID=UPI0008858690|nr:pilus assembly protein PilM [Butyrivibrio sp. INlla16]SDB15039.1 type IV pilus assembly protein PilM [Butyrivibrio sp. INlla16]
MANNQGILGISVSHGILAMTLMKGDIIRKSFWEEIPSNIVEDNKILSQNLFAEFLKEQMKDKGIKCKNAAYVIADNDIFVRKISMPSIDDEQLRYNIPYEFKDFIKGELNQYVFDYVKRKNPDNEDNLKVDLLAYAVPLELLNSLRETLKMAGLRLVKALPETSVYEAMLGALGDEEEVTKERCFLDIGRRVIRMMIFKNGEFKLSHTIDIGENAIIQALADDMNVDSHLALTYLRQNYNDCNQMDAAVNAYKDISIEIMKGLNFYEMSDMTSRLGEAVICGTGALTEPLVEMLKKRIDKNVQTMDELYPKYSKDKTINVTYSSVGILLSDALGVETNSNLAAAGTKKKKNIWAILGVIAAAILVLAVVFKFTLLDKINLLLIERSRAAALQEQVSGISSLIDGAGDLQNEYYHYTWDTMNAEERSRISRVDAAQLVDLIGHQNMKVTYMDLVKGVMTINLKAKSLEAVSKLTMEINDQEIVESCSVVSAQTIEDDDRTEEIESGVDAEIKVHLVTESSEEE